MAISEAAKLDLDSIRRSYELSLPYQKIGKIHTNRGSVYEVSLAKAVLGSNVEFVTDSGDSCYGEVIAIKENKCLAMPYNEISGVNSDTKVYLRDLTTSIPVGGGLLGRVVNSRCEPIDGKGPIAGECEFRSIFGKPVNPLDRPPISESLDTGVHAINCFMTAGKGQRLAIMAGSGVGKSVTLGMIAQGTNADINVISMIGERGREVLEFIENDLGPEGLKRSIIVVATSDESPLIRTKAAYVATTIAEYFRDTNKDVLFMMDSITRFAMANREISLLAGEPPGQKGYTPSIFAKLPKLMERAGTSACGGSVTGFYTVLVEGGDLDEPISDAIRAISDGHIVLSRELAERNHFPAIDILQSISRVMNKVVTKEHRVVSAHLRDLLSSYRDTEDLINAGAYERGSNHKVDKALEIYEDFMLLMRQDHDDYESLNIAELFDKMVELAGRAEGTTVELDSEIEEQ